MSLRLQTLLILLLAGATPVILMLFTANYLFGQRLEREALERMQSTLHIAEEQIRDRTERNFSEVKALVEHPQLHLKQGEDILQHVLEMYHIFQRDDTRITVYCNRKRVRKSTEVNGGKEQNMKAINAALGGDIVSAGGTTWRKDRKTKKSLHVLDKGLYVPIRSKNGDIEFVVRQYISVQDLAPKIPCEGHLFLLDSEHRVLATNTDTPLRVEWNTLMSGWQAGLSRGRCVDIEGRAFQFVSTGAKEFDILGTATLLYLLPVDEAFASLAFMHRMFLTVGLFSLCLLGFLALLAANYLGRPLRAAARSASFVAEGNLDTVLSCEGPSELKDLSMAFNQMTAQVKRHRHSLKHTIQVRTQRLHETLAYLRATLDGLNDALVMVDAELQQVRFSNRKANDWFQLGGIQGQVSSEAFHEGIRQWFKDKEKWNEFVERMSCSREKGEAQFTSSQKNIRNLEVISAPVLGPSGTIGRLWMFRDVTERETLQLSLRQSQKHEALGRMAGGIAHDFNNILTAIQGAFELVTMDVEENLDPQESIHTGLTACKRATGVVKQLLGFSRKREDLSMEPVQINDLVRETIGMMRPNLNPLIVINPSLPEELHFIHADEGQICQVIMNMVINACDAMPEGGGLLNLTSSHVEINQGDLLAPGAYPGRFVCLEVSDTGSGMGDDVLAQIFDPFFTTKPVGKGTGLGLANSMNIMRSHKGWIECDSTVGVGTRFTLYFPVWEEGDENTPSVSENSKPISLQEYFKGNVLIVDDESQIRRIARQMLERDGHTVLDVENGLKALELLAHTSFDLVILDLTMPKISGFETLHRIKKTWPSLPVLIWTGFSEEAPRLFGGPAELHPDGFLAKPFRGQELRRHVAEIMRRTIQNRELIEDSEPSTDSRSDDASGEIITFA